MQLFNSVFVLLWTGSGSSASSVGFSGFRPIK